MSLTQLESLRSAGILIAAWIQLRVLRSALSSFVPSAYWLDWRGKSSRGALAYETDCKSEVRLFHPRMSRATPEMRAFAKCLIDYETGGNILRETDLLADFRASDKLRPHLLALMGRTGFRSLLSRALAMAGEEVAWLRAIHISKDGTLEGLADLRPEVKKEQFNQGSIVLLAQMLGSLVAFVGEDVTLRQMRQVWPKLPLQNLSFKSGVRDE